MHSLSRALMRQDDSNEPFRFGWKCFEQYGIDFRRGEMHMIAAGPGGGKSTLALRMALSMSDYRVLYICCDTSWHTIAVRALMMLLNDATLNGHGRKGSLYSREVEEKMKATPADYARLIDTKMNHIEWMFEPSPSVEDINVALAAYREVHGVLPDVVFVDNLTDIDHGAEQEHVGLKATMKELSKVALGTRSAFVVLHHINEGNTYEKCPPMKAVTGKINQKAALVLTLESNDVGDLWIAPVKNRYGRADVSGETYVPITWDKVHMAFKDHDQPLREPLPEGWS